MNLWYHVESRMKPKSAQSEAAARSGSTDTFDAQNIIIMPQLPVVSQLLGFLVHHQNLLKTLPLPTPSPKNIPTPSWMATLTGCIGAESYTCGQGCGRGLGARWGFAAECGLDESKVKSFSYMEGKRRNEARSVYFGLRVVIDGTCRFQTGQDLSEKGGKFM
jgi:hypothetical protein